MKKVLKFVLPALALLSLVSCEKESGKTALSAKGKALKTAVTGYVEDVVYPIYDKLADETQTLLEQLGALKEKGAANLVQKDIDDVCETFKSARAWWEKSEAFLFGAATKFGIDPHIDTWPLNKEKLAIALSNAATLKNLADNGAEAVDELGESALGFHGIEFILFRDGANRSVAALKANETDAAFSSVSVSGQSELVFAAAVAEDLRNWCARLQVAWDVNAPEARIALMEELEMETTLEGSGWTYGKNLLKAASLGSTYVTWQEAVVNILVAGCSNIANEVASTKIGTAHYVSSKEYDKDYIESPYSHRSYYDFKDNILSIQYSLYGGLVDKPADGSLSEFFKKEKYKGAAALEDALDGAIASLDACIASGKAFVEDPTAAVAEKAIVAIQKLDEQLNAAADWVSNI